MPSQKLRPVQKSAPGIILCVMKISAIIYFVLEEYLLGIAYFVCEENLCHNIFCEVNLTITQSVRRINVFGVKWEIYQYSTFITSFFISSFIKCL